MAKIGIVCDNYKRKTFKKKLNKNGFYNLEFEEINKSLTAIKVETDIKNQDKIHAICREVETIFAAKRNVN